MSKEEVWVYPRARCVRVVDGDTLVLEVDTGFGTRFVDYFRLYGIDTWEMRRPTLEEGRAAKAHTQEFVGPALFVAKGGWPLAVKTYKDRQWHDKQGKYGRYLADVIDGNGESLTESLRANGHEKRRR